MSVPLYLANNFINKALPERIALSPMKLQKLIYFVYRDYLQQTGVPLFSERFSAWKYGPVVESVYYTFKDYKSNSINRFVRDSKDAVEILKEDGVVGQVINSVWERYKYFDGIYLSKLTHQYGTAWYNAWERKDTYLNDGDITNERQPEVGI